MRVFEAPLLQGDELQGDELQGDELQIFFLDSLLPYYFVADIFRVSIVQHFNTKGFRMITTTSPTTAELAAIDKAARSILSDNTKLRKLPDGSAIINAGISLAPAKRSGVVNVCPHATAACIAACVLWFAGRTVTAVVRKAAIARTKLWHFWPARFYDRLHRSLSALERRARKLGVRAFCRLNVASDIEHPHDVCTRHPSITYYDYSKDVERCRRYARGEFPANYHLSYSLHENSTFQDVQELHAAGVNIVTVFDSYYFGPRHRYGILPAAVEFRNSVTGESFTVSAVDGDVHDLRVPEFDGRGVVVGLRLKGGRNSKAAAIRAGFARHFAAGARWFAGELVREGTAVVELRDATPAAASGPLVILSA